MKKITVIVAVACSNVLAIAHGAEQRNAFSGAFAELAGKDQAEFIATVNRSLADPEKPLDDRRIKTLYRVNRDAVRGAPAADRKTVLAEVFATVPKACLPLIVERFAKELFSRKAAGFGENDDSFVEFASAALMRISLRCRTADDFPGTRTAFAVVMFLKASEGRPASLREDFMVYIHSGTHAIARKEWIPAALGDDGRQPTLAPMMESGIYGEEPEHKIKLPQAPIEELNRLVGAEHRISHAWDLSPPQPIEIDRAIPGGDGTASGLWRVPRPSGRGILPPPWRNCPQGRDEPDVYLGQGL